MRLKQYLMLPEVIADRLVKQINANQDERIERKEFVSFFLTAFMGTLEQKMLIAFRCYDLDGDDMIVKEEAELVLKSIPLLHDERYGFSFRG